MTTPETARDERARHTPGPWAVAEHSGYGPLNGRVVVSSRSGLAMAVAMGDEPERDAAANATLIAAAPDLLAALRLFLADDRFVVSVGGNPNAVVVMMAHAHAALAKAEGRS